MSKTTAMFFTFLLSACLHELVMVVVTHKFRCAQFFVWCTGDSSSDTDSTFSRYKLVKKAWFFDTDANLVIDCANTNDCA